MDSQKLNDWLQIIGLFGVIASLVFVGLQMRQSYKLALSDNYLQIVANHIAANEAIAANPDIFLRGNAADELSPEEMTIYETQVGNLANITWHQIEWDKEMDKQVWADTDVVEFALFLHQNPGAYDVWLRREEDLRRYRALMNPKEKAAQEWMDLVHKAITRIEEDQSINGS